MIMRRTGGVVERLMIKNLDRWMSSLIRTCTTLYYIVIIILSYFFYLLLL